MTTNGRGERKLREKIFSVIWETEREHNIVVTKVTRCRQINTKKTIVNTSDCDEYYNDTNEQINQDFKNDTNK